MKNYVNRIGRAAFGVLAGGMVLSSSCSSRDIDAVVNSVGAVVDVVSGQSVNTASGIADLAGLLADAIDNNN